MDDRFVNLGEEVILTLLWQSGASESETVCFVISLFAIDCSNAEFCASCVCVWERESHITVSCVCVCVCVWERERAGHITACQRLIAVCLQSHTSIITVSVTWLCSSLGLELMVKLTTLLTVFTLILKAEARDYGKGRYISDECLRCSANHNALCQLANQSRLRLSEGGTL